MGRADLIGNGKHHLIPTFQPAVSACGAPRKNMTQAQAKAAPRAAPQKGNLQTQHTGLPPRDNGAAQRKATPQRKPR